MKMLLAPLALLGLLASPSVMATECWWTNPANTPNSTYSLSINQTVNLNGGVAIGNVLAKVAVYYSSHGDLLNTEAVTCKRNAKRGVAFDTTGRELVEGYTDVYKTNVDGVGLRFGLGYGTTLSATMSAPSGSYNYQPNNGSQGASTLPRYALYEFIRTGVGVGSGQVDVSFSGVYTPTGVTAPSSINYQVSSGSKITLTNTSYFSTCRLDHQAGAGGGSVPVITVPMGIAVVSNLQQGLQAPARTFGFEVTCNGLNPSTPLPVKVYFEGESLQPGLLKLENHGQPGTAQGIGIALENSAGTQLPFDRTSAISLTWSRREPQKEIYKFSGRARYVTTGGPITPGEANGTMDIILVYN